MVSSTLPFRTFPSPSPNVPSLAPPSPTATTFTLAPPPSHPTDIWRKPSNPTSNPTAQISTFNAPLIYKAIPLSSLKRVRVTVTASYERLYDQGGLVLILPAEDGKEGKIEETAKWVKTGVEFVEGKAWVSTVACDNWADWSLSSAGITPSSSDDKIKTVTLEMERHEVEGTLWIYVLDKGGRVPLRECTWILSSQGHGGGQERKAWVGVYAATPIVEGRGAEDGLEVEFRDWQLELTE